jgi:hypothetical protein
MQRTDTTTAMELELRPHHLVDDSSGGSDEAASACDEPAHSLQGLDVEKVGLVLHWVFFYIRRRGESVPSLYIPFLCAFAWLCVASYEDARLVVSRPFL